MYIVLFLKIHMFYLEFSQENLDIMCMYGITVVHRNLMNTLQIKMYHIHNCLSKNQPSSQLQL